MTRHQDWALQARHPFDAEPERLLAATRSRTARVADVRRANQCQSVPEAERMTIRHLPDDGQRHLRHGAGRADAAVDLAVGIVLAAVLDQKVQPHAPAFAGHLAAIGFAGQIHPGAGAVLEPVAVDAERRVYVQAEALGAAALAQADLE